MCVTLCMSFAPGTCMNLNMLSAIMCHLNYSFHMIKCVLMGIILPFQIVLY